MTTTILSKQMPSVSVSASSGRSLSSYNPCRYLSLCFAMVAKKMLDVKLQRTVIKRQAGRPPREMKENVEVLHYSISYLHRSHSITLRLTSRCSSTRSKVPPLKSVRYFFCFSCFVLFQTFPKNTFGTYF